MWHVRHVAVCCAGSEQSHEDRRRSSQVYQHYGPPQFVKKGQTKTRKVHPGLNETLGEDGVVYKEYDIHKFTCQVKGRDGQLCGNEVTQHDTSTLMNNHVGMV